jgi:hypothetical protein
MTEPVVVEGACLVCLRRRPYRQQVCDACRSRLRWWLREIPDLIVQLLTLGYVVRDVRGVRRDDEGRIWPHWDPAAHALPPGPIPGKQSSPRVSGSMERGVPDRLDLTAPAYRDREGTTDGHADQLGGPSVAAVLDSWVRWWIQDRGRGERVPGESVTELVGWLDVRLDDACDSFDAISDFADELREVWISLHRANGLTEPRPEPCLGVPCRSCDQKALLRVPGSPYIECGGCGGLYTEDEYHTWVRLVARSAIHDQETAS